MVGGQADKPTERQHRHERLVFTVHLEWENENETKRSDLIPLFDDAFFMFL